MTKPSATDPAAAEPTSGHSARYHTGNAEATGDGRLFSPIFPRNSPAIVAALTPWLTGLTGPALEIGSGTGQHAMAFAAAFPRLDWVPSDPDAGHRASIAAWTRQQNARLAAPLALDAGTPWAERAEVQALGRLALVIALNVIHIAPATVARGIVAGAAARLAPGGYLAFYGPFRQAGRHIGQGNATFDARLRAENPDWGLRDTEEIVALAEAARLAFAALVAMPANNRLLIFSRPCAG